jgi:mRNA interferase HicA
LKGSEFLRKTKRYADRKRLNYRWAPSRGAGSHGTVYVGERMTVVKDLKKELGSGLFRSMCRDLDIDPREF